MIHTYESTVAAVQDPDNWDECILWVPSEQAVAIVVGKTPVAVRPELSGNSFEVREDMDWSRVVVPTKKRGGGVGEEVRDYQRLVRIALMVAGVFTPSGSKQVELRPGDLITLRTHGRDGREGELQVMATLLRRVSDDEADGWYAIDDVITHQMLQLRI